MEDKAITEVWHYTSLDTCLDILKGQELWFSDILTTNDETDGRHVKAVLRGHYINKLKSSTSRQFRRAKKPTEADFIKEERQTLENLFGALIRKDSTCPFTGFIFCFSKTDSENGDDGRLSMWRGYGKKSPAAILFDIHKFRHKFSEILKPIKTLTHNNCRDISYTGDVGKILDGYGEYLAALEPCFSVHWDLKATEAILKAVIMLSFQLKHPGFYEENEVRAAIITSNLGHHPIHEENGKRVYKLPANELLRECIQKIVVGPQKHQNDAAKKIANQLKNIELDIPIHLSEIPYVEASNN